MSTSDEKTTTPATNTATGNDDDGGDFRDDPYFFVNRVEMLNRQLRPVILGGYLLGIACFAFWQYKNSWVDSCLCHSSLPGFRGAMDILSLAAALMFTAAASMALWMLMIFNALPLGTFHDWIVLSRKPIHPASMLLITKFFFLGLLMFFSLICLCFACNSHGSRKPVTSSGQWIPGVTIAVTAAWSAWVMSLIYTNKYSLLGVFAVRDLVTGTTNRDE